MTAASQTISLRFLNRAQVESLSPEDDELVNVIEAGLRAHGQKETVLPPKSHLVLDHLVNGHFNILAGYVGPIRQAGVKVGGRPDRLGTDAVGLDGLGDRPRRGLAGRAAGDDRSELATEVDALLQEDAVAQRPVRAHRGEPVGQVLGTLRQDDALAVIPAPGGLRDDGPADLRAGAHTPRRATVPARRFFKNGGELSHG